MNEPFTSNILQSVAEEAAKILEGRFYRDPSDGTTHYQSQPDLKKGYPKHPVSDKAKAASDAAKDPASHKLAADAHFAAASFYGSSSRNHDFHIHHADLHSAKAKQS